MLRPSYKRGWLIVLVLVVSFGVCRPAQAAGFFGGNPDRQPSVLTYAWRGMGIGTAVGVSGGYLLARRDGWVRDDWKSLAYGAGFGALGGVTLGLTLGFVDLADEEPGMASLALRDMAMGAGLGAAIGLIAGGLAVIGNEDPESLALGTSIGVIGGTALGLVVGLIEGRRITESPRHRARPVQLWPVVAAVQVSDRRSVHVLGVGGSFP